MQAGVLYKSTVQQEGKLGDIVEAFTFNNIKKIK